MKLVKNFSRVALVAALACSFALTSCKDDEDDAQDCATLLQNISTTAEAYIMDGSESNCKAAKSAIQTYVNSGCDNAASFEAQLAFYQCD